MERSERAARIFKVLSVDTGVRMIELLKSRSLCVNALAREIGITAAAVSQHLRVLRDADIVRADKQGYFVHYTLDRSTLAAWSTLTGELLDAPEAEEECNTT